MIKPSTSVITNRDRGRGAKDPVTCSIDTSSRKTSFIFT